MKKIYFLILILTAFTASALLTTPFPGYDLVEEYSPDIFIASCVSNPPTILGSGTRTDAVNTYGIEIVSTIKGTNQPGPAILNSLHWLNVGDNYLVFGLSWHGVYQGLEDYRVVPLGREAFRVGEIKNSIAGKPKNEQLQILFRRAADHLAREIKKDEKQKQQLETAIIK